MYNMCKCIYSTFASTNVVYVHMAGMIVTGNFFHLHGYFIISTIILLFEMVFMFHLFSL